MPEKESFELNHYKGECDVKSESETIRHPVENLKIRESELEEADEVKKREVRDKINTLDEENVDIQGSLTHNLISEEDKESLQREIKKIKSETRFQAPSLFKGNETATEYDSQVANFSTQTKIVELPSGRKIFLIENYHASTLHRGLDTIMKKLTGCKMRKAKSKKWKQQFESKSQILTLPIEEDNLVALDYIPNVNLYDLFANQEEVENWGECDFAKNVSMEELLKIIDKIVDKTKDVHNKGIAWGELILPNMIIDKTQNVHICDPEVSYDKSVSLAEQKARDLVDLINSIAAVMKQKSGIDYLETTGKIIDRYGDAEVLSELKKLVENKPNFISRMFFGYTKARLGLKDKKEFEDIRKSILLKLSE